MDKNLQSGQFRAALRIVRASLQERINQTAQTSLANDILCVAVGLRSASLVDQLFLQRTDIDRIQSLFHHSSRFSMLDLLSVGQDHIFIINRDILLRDIHDFLSEPPKGLHRVFVNIDHHLSKPEIMPSNRCHALEDYVRDFLLPELEHRVENWREGEHCYVPLPIPDKTSLMTLTGWLLDYPVLYVIPKKATARRLAAWKRKHLLGRSLDADSVKDGESDDAYSADEDGEEDEDEEDCSRNCLANQLLIVTKVQLEPSEDVDGLTDHCLLSFSYPAELAEQWMDRTNTPESPVSSAPDYDHDYDDDEDDDSDEFVDASDVEYTEMGSNPALQETLASTTDATRVSDCVPEYKPEAVTADNLESSEPFLPPQPQANGGLRTKASEERDHMQDTPPSHTSPSTRRRQGLPLHAVSDSDCYGKKRAEPLLPPCLRNPDICAAGRSFLHQLHARFQKQTVWKAWEVGQQKVKLPVVAM